MTVNSFLTLLGGKLFLCQGSFILTYSFENYNKSKVLFKEFGRRSGKKHYSYTLSPEMYFCYCFGGQVTGFCFILFSLSAGDRIQDHMCARQDYSPELHSQPRNVLFFLIFLLVHISGICCYIFICVHNLIWSVTFPNYKCAYKCKNLIWRI